ncbi:S-layer homology domain-containing protein [Thiolapillus sp.]
MNYLKKIATAALMLSGAGMVHANTQTIIIVDSDRTFEIEVESTEMLGDGSLKLNVAPHYTEMINPVTRTAANLMLSDASLDVSAGCNWSSWSMDSEGQITLNTDANEEPCGDPAYNWPLYRDVYSFHWAHDAIQSLTNAGISSGCDDTHFCPDDSVNRAQMAVFLEKSINGSDFIPEAPQGMFTDVPTDHWAAAWIERLALDEITSGCGDGFYCPDDQVSRAQMAPLILRAVHLNDNTQYTPPTATGEIFNDIPADYWVADWIEALFQEEITSGCEDGSIYCPDDMVSRAQMATFLTRAFQLNQ